MGDVIDRAAGRTFRTLARSEGGQPRSRGNRAATRPISDSWFAAVLIPIIIGCMLFAATSQ